ncbi:MAG: hypothetical protein OER95_13665, partial [Acidimicrobiia bacterium]|nr:hypothetical protein [Acidimicrobiia bacterium]
MTAGVEAALVALLGGVAGLVAWKLAVPVSDRLAVGPVSWWAEDVQVSWSAIVTMMVAIVVTTVVTVQLGLRRVAVSPLAARTEPAAAKPRLIRLLPLLAGLAALLVNVVVVEPWPTNRWFITFGGANILFVVGLIVALPLSGRLASTLVGFAGHRPWAALASARIRHEPGLVARTTAGLLTMTIVAGFALAVAVSLQMAVESTVGRPGDGRLRLEVSTAPVDQESLTSLDGVIHAVPVVATNIDGVWLRAYRADCQQVSAVATTVTGECGSGLLQPTTVVFPEWEAALGTLPGPPVSF